MDKVLLGNYLCEILNKDYKRRIDTIGRIDVKFYDNINDRIDDERNGLVSFPVEMCYGDFFILLPHTITFLDLPFLEMTLNKPYGGTLYVSSYDKRMQVRISGYILEKRYKLEEGI